MAPDQQAAVDAILGKGGAAAPAEGPSPDESGEHAIDEESLDEGALDAAASDLDAALTLEGDDRRAALKGVLRALISLRG
jgi:hypothetical protein